MSLSRTSSSNDENMYNLPVVKYSDDDVQTSSCRPTVIKRIKREERLQKEEERFASCMDYIKEEMARTNYDI